MGASRATSRRLLALVAAVLAVTSAWAGNADATTPFYGSTGDVRLAAPIVGMAAAPGGTGYWLVASDGGVFAFGSAAYHGSTGDLRLRSPVVGMAPSRAGYWLVARDGGVFAFGDARFLGAPVAEVADAEVVGIVPTATEDGYWVVASDGHVWAYGDAAADAPRTGGHAPRGRVVGFAAHPAGHGFWTVTADGAVAAYGGAVHVGDVEGVDLARPVVGMAATAGGTGYWLVASDGGVFALGGAPFHGSTGAWRLTRPVVGMAATPDGSGYWLVASDGGIFAFPTDVVVEPTGGGPTVAGCPVLPADDPWNQRIDGAAVHPDSARWVQRLGATRGAHPDFGADWDGGPFGIPYVVVGPDQPPVAIRWDAYGDESDPGPYPVPADAPVEGGSGGDGDRHVLVVERGACRLFELYRAFPGPGTGWTADSGAVWDLRTGGLRPEGWTSADAAGLPIFPGLVRYDEVAAGAIRHALRVTVGCSQAGHVLPATHHAASGGGGADCPPMGARLRLRADRVDPSRFHGQARVVVEAMLTYGLIVADNGSSWYVSGAPDSRWDDDDLGQVKSLRGADFEFVDTGPIRR